MNSPTIDKTTAPPNFKGITVNKKLSFDAYSDVAQLTRRYYDAIRKGEPLPKEKLPELTIMLEAAQIVNSYMENCNKGLTLKLYNAALPEKEVVAVWLFSQHQTLQMGLGKYQLFIVKG